MERSHLNKIKMKKANKHLYILLLPLLIACSDKDIDDKTYDGLSDNIELDIVISRAGDDSNELEKEDPEKYFKVGESCVLISQQFTSPGITIDFSEGSKNCYKYIYNGNTDANWDTGFNFSSDSPLRWEKVMLNGQFNSGYAFGALFFPRDYKYTEEVSADQSNPDVLIESDVLGAWHRTSYLNERLRFRMFHLMCKLKVNLYIPVFDEEKGNGIDPDEVIASGVNFMTSYKIDWPDRTSDLSPLLNGTSDKIQDIIMYRNGDPVKIENMSVSNYDEKGTDNVWKYSFEMLFPYQKIEGDLLRFSLKRGDMTYNYLFNSNKNAIGNAGITFEQGTVNQLELYLPRHDNEIVLLRAYLKDWNEAQASFTITEDVKEEN